MPLAEHEERLPHGAHRARQGPRLRPRGGRDAAHRCRVELDGRPAELTHGSVVIAAITSCTNTSNPSVMIGAGLLARKAVRARAAACTPHVKTSLAPGSKVVTEYLRQVGPAARPRGARLPRRRLRLHDLHRQQRPAARRRSSKAVNDGKLVAAAVLSRQPQLRGPRQPRREGELPRLAAAGRRLRARRHDRHRPDERAARHGRRRQAGLPRATSGRRQKEIADDRGVGRRARCSSRSYGNVFDGNPELERDPGRGRRALSTSTRGRRPTSRSRRSSRASRSEPPPLQRRRGRPRAGAARRLGDHRPHLAGRRHRARQSRPAATWSSTASQQAGLQLLRLAPRQRPRDGARHLRQHPAQEPDGARAWRAASPSTCPSGEQHDDLRRGRALPGRGHAARGARRQGVRHRQLARLGRQGHAAARRARGDRGELRAHPPLEPGRHGRPAAAVQAGRERRVSSASPGARRSRSAASRASSSRART